MSRPTEPVPTPFVVTDIAAGRPVAPIWVNDHGDSGVADPWADLAIAEWSLRYNDRGDRRGESFDGDGVAPDQGRMDDYLRMWEDGY